MDVYERLDDMSADTAEARAAHILHGLGFTAKMQRTPTKDFSGGWRMRIALARCVETLQKPEENISTLFLMSCCFCTERKVWMSTIWLKLLDF